jgi:hypothetical protein
MKNFKPTHFIEQYNTLITKGCNHTNIHKISFLADSLKFTANTFGLKTVAIFKIQFKKQ